MEHALAKTMMADIKNQMDKEMQTHKNDIYGEYLKLEISGRMHMLIHYNSGRSQAPVYFDIHGGGFYWGTIEDGDLLCHDICCQLGFDVYALDYPLGAQAEYPCALEWLYDTINYLRLNTESFHFDREKMFIGGRSAGGNLAAALCLMAKDRKEFSFAGQILDHPFLDLSGIIQKDQRYTGLNAMPPEFIEIMSNAYANESNRKDSYCSPLNASKEQLQGLPPTIIQTCEWDSLRPDGDIYADKLTDSGVLVFSHCFPGAIHGFTQTQTPEGIKGRQWLMDRLAELVSMMKPNEYTEDLELWHSLPMGMRPKIRYWLPAAAMDKEDLRLEIHKLFERGFGGVEVVVLAMLPEEIARGETGWGSALWNEMMDVIAETTNALGMTMDIANGPAWPISTPEVESAEDPAALRELTWGEKDLPSGTRYTGALPAPRKLRDEGKPKLIHVMAYLETADRVLEKESYVDLMPFLDLDRQLIDWEVPTVKAGHWKLFAFYSQPSGQKTNAGQCYVIDHLGRAGAQACERYWDKVFKDRNYPSMESFFCDSLEYEVAMEWSPDFAGEFETRRGYSLLPYLPFVGMADTYPACDIPGYTLEDKKLSEMVNHDYKETLTQCYCENHLAVLENMAKKYGKTIRYQVAYNKPFEVERSALSVSIPENEALGRPAVDYQKTMAAAAHLGRKERYSFECAAEFGHSYGQDYEDLLWWVKRSLMAGMNAQVLHGASYSGGYSGKHSVDGQIPGSTWPGFEGFGKFVSNYWNRTLSIPDAKGCLDTVTRLNMVFRKQARVDCAIFRNAYGSDGLGSEFCLYPDGGRLSNKGYSYETVTEYLLQLPVCTVTDGILDKDGVGYKCLIIPEVKFLSLTAIRRLEALAVAGWPILWVGKRPDCAMFYGEWDSLQKQQEWQQAIERLWTMKGVLHACTLKQVPDVLEAAGIVPEIRLAGDMDIMTAVRWDRENHWRYYALYGYNPVEYAPEEPNSEELAVSAIYKKGTTKPSYRRPGTTGRKHILAGLKGNGNVYRCDPWSGRKEKMAFADNGSGYMAGWLDIEEDEMILLAMDLSDVGQTKGQLAAKPDLCLETQAGTMNTSSGNRVTVTFTELELESFEPIQKGEVSFFRSGFSGCKQCLKLEQLLPWRHLDHRLEHFAGRGTYYGFVNIEAFDPNRRYILSLGEVSDTFTVVVNGKAADFPDQVMKRVDITGLLHDGANELKVVVVSNLYNRLFSEHMPCWPMELVYVPRDYGIWESDTKQVGVFLR